MSDRPMNDEHEQNHEKGHFNRSGDSLLRVVAMALWPLCASFIFLSLLIKGENSARQCRCLSKDPCWSKIPWNSLNASVGGRLLVVRDELSACKEGTSNSSRHCQKQLEKVDDEFWLSSQASGYLHVGQYGTWNISDRLASYAVAAETESDFQETPQTPIPPFIVKSISYCHRPPSPSQRSTISD